MARMAVTHNSCSWSFFAAVVGFEGLWSTQTPRSLAGFVVRQDCWCGVKQVQYGKGKGVVVVVGEGRGRAKWVYVGGTLTHEFG